ncbi:hypothetical protein Leryth_014439 [Lithospermum erythrorhizon]|nr:hypothetical protein Leryth_014439 [Lithospermum erythrorhizon]
MENKNPNENQSNGIPMYNGKYSRYNVLGNSFEVSSKYLPPIQPLGRGAYGMVCSALDSETKEEVAIKKIGNAFDNRIDAKRTLREIKLLTHMDHENVIKIKDVIPPPDKENFSDVYIVYELMDTDLHQIIQSSQKLTEDHCQYQREPLFPGKDYVQQLALITELLGSPEDSDLGFLKSDNAMMISLATSCLEATIGRDFPRYVTRSH